MLYLNSKYYKWEIICVVMNLEVIDIKELTMWYDNARYAYELADEKECIITLFEIAPGEKKMKNLLNEINKVGGLRETLIVYKDNNMNIVLDGNRRISLLLIAKYPDLIEKYKIPDQSIEKIKKIRSINCSVYSDLEEAYDHVESRHQGEREGRGVVPWDSGGRQRMKEIRGQETSLGYRVLQFFKNSNLPQHAFVKEHIKNISTIERILCKKYIYSGKFGLKSKYEYDLDNLQIINKLNELFVIFYRYNSDGPVKSVYTASDVEELFSSLKPIGDNTEQLVLEFEKKPNPMETENGREEKGRPNDTMKNEHKKKRNNYKSSIVKLFKWSSKGINISNSCLNYYIKALNSYSLNSTSIMQNKFLYDAAPIYYRIILECAIREFTDFINILTNRNKFNAIPKENYNCFNSTSKTTSLVTGNKLYGIYDISKRIKDNDKKKEINVLIKELNRINMNSIEKYNSFVDALNEVVHGSVKSLSDEKMLEYDTITVVNLQLISIMINK